MTEYKKEFPLPVLFPPEVPSNTLAEWFSKKDIPQFHCAGLQPLLSPSLPLSPFFTSLLSFMLLPSLPPLETEKYAHVTFFFNGGREQPWSGEDRLMVPSPKVATYDLQPEMSAEGVGREVNEDSYPY